MKKKHIWNRCNKCGKFISYEDLDEGNAKVEVVWENITNDPMLPPDYRQETWSLICRKCYKEKE